MKIKELKKQLLSKIIDHQINLKEDISCMSLIRIELSIGLELIEDMQNKFESKEQELGKMYKDILDYAGISNKDLDEFDADMEEMLSLYPNIESLHRSLGEFNDMLMDFSENYAEYLDNKTRY